MKLRRMKAHSFSHVAITVADFNRSVRWYADNRSWWAPLKRRASEPTPTK
jgi:catechol 2,3-dioxygenase-like lactoylglutathione lyase family enzyme